MNDRKPKILICTTIPLTIEAFLVKSSEFLHNKGNFDIHFVCSKASSIAAKYPNFTFHNVNFQRGFHPLGLFQIFPIIRLLKVQRYDIVQYSTPNAAFLVSIASWLSKIRIRLYAQWGIYYQSKSGFSRFLYRLLEKTICILSTHIQPDSKSNLEFSIRERLYKAEKGSVVWNGSACGIDTVKFSPSNINIYRRKLRSSLEINDTDIVLGFVGRVTKEKGVLELLQCFQNISTYFVNLHLIIIGSMDSSLNESIELVGWAKNFVRVHFLGHVNNANEWISSMDIFVLPSYREGFGMVILEASASGIPVIATRIPGPIDALIEGKTGLLVYPKDVIDLQSKLISLIEDNEYRKSLGINGVDFVLCNFEQKEFFGRLLCNRYSILESNSNR